MKDTKCEVHTTRFTWTLRRRDMLRRLIMLSKALHPPPPAHNDQQGKELCMGRDQRRVFSSITVFVYIVFFISRDGLRELLFPPFVYFLMVKSRKYKFKDVRVPICGVTLDAFFDILQKALCQPKQETNRGIVRIHLTGTTK